MTGLHPARFAAEVGRAVRAAPPHVRDDLPAAPQKAESEPWRRPAAGGFEPDGAGEPETTVRVLTTADALVHSAILPAPPHLRVLAALRLRP